MVVDYIENIKTYEFIHKNFKKGAEFALTLLDKPIGKYECDDFFAMVQIGETKEYNLCKFETHRKYIDVQFVVSGSEILEWDNVKNLEIDTNYDEKSDCALYKGEGDRLSIKKNMFYIAYPSDAHKPCTHREEQTSYKKIVLKLKI
ncbi:MAG: YhcH/YjgK/YiaL family protein [Lachnospirales bacterium]